MDGAGARGGAGLRWGGTPFSYRALSTVRCLILSCCGVPATDAVAPTPVTATTVDAISAMPSAERMFMNPPKGDCRRDVVTTAIIPPRTGPSALPMRASAHGY